MGCCGGSEIGPDANSPISMILKELTEKEEDLTKNFVEKENDLNNEKLKILKKREKKVPKAIEKNVEKKELEELIKKYNLKEKKNEKKFIKLKTEKMKTLFEIGVGLADKLKTLSLDKLKEKLDKAPSFAKAALNSQIEVLNKKSGNEILNSELGKPLKAALEKKGLNETFLQDYMNDLKAERQKRRKEEREKFKIEKNEFPEDEIEYKTKDLFDYIQDEYEDEMKDKAKNKLNQLFPDLGDEVVVSDDSDDEEEKEKEEKK